MTGVGSSEGSGVFKGQVHAGSRVGAAPYKCRHFLHRGNNRTEGRKRKQRSMILEPFGEAIPVELRGSRPEFFPAVAVGLPQRCRVRSCLLFISYVADDLPIVALGCRPILHTTKSSNNQWGQVESTQKIQSRCDQ